MSTAAPSVVHVRLWPAWFLGNSPEESITPWRKGLTLTDVVPARVQGGERLRVYVNGVLTDDMARTVDPGDFVDVSASPTGVTPAVVGLAAGPVAATGLSAGALFAAQVFASFAINAALHFLVPKPKGPKRRGDEESPSQAWSSLQNVRGEGQPKQIIYGEYRAVPQILDEFIVNFNTPAESYYYVLLSLGEGPVYSIGNQTADTPQDAPLTSELGNVLTGVQLNGNDLLNFDGVEAHVRMGTNDQLPIRGFEFINTVYDVGVVLDQQEYASGESTATLAFATYNSNAANDQAVWDRYGFSFSLTAEADAWSITFTFASGLYMIDSSGNVQDATFRPLVRYRELDALSVPITTGGDNGDGWVYEVPLPALKAHHQSAFNYEVSGVFRNPQVYTPGVIGNCLSCDGVNDYAATSATPVVPASWAPGGQLAGLTFYGWVKFTSLPTTAGIAHQPIIEWGNTGTNGGWAVGISKQLVSPFQSTPAWRWVATFYSRKVGNGTAISTLYDQPGASGINTISDTSRYYFMAVTYRKVPSGGNGLQSIYVDGQLVQQAAFGSSSDNIAAVAAARPFEIFRANGIVKQANGGVAINTAAKGDEFVVLDREMSIQEIQALYNGGNGVSGQSNPHVIAGWHFANTSTTTTPDFGPSGNTLTLNNGAATTSGGIVITADAADIKTSLYEVQAMRWNKTVSDTSLSPVQDQVTWTTLTGKFDEWLSYPNTALLGLKIKATDQLNTTAPTVTVLTKGMLVPVWDGVSTTSPNVSREWSQNPAWIGLDLITNKRYGIGNYFEYTHTILNSIKELADYCDELVYDGRGERQAIHESTTTAPIADLVCDSTLNGGSGGIQVVFRNVTAPFEPPRNWFVGGYVAFTSLPAPNGTYTTDISTANISGFPITDISFNGGSWIVTLAYDFTPGTAPWTDGGNLSTSSGTTVSGTAEGREPRFQYDAQHDTFQAAWDALIDILSTCRAMPVREGNKIRFRYERPRMAVDMVNHASIKPGSFEIEYPGRLDRPNSYTVEFFDRLKNYARSPASQDDPALEAGTLAEDINSENFTLIGVTRRSQIVREMLWRLNMNRLSDRLGRFSNGLEGISGTCGDVVQISHDIVPYGKSGRILNDTSTTTSIALDRDIVLGAGTYYLRVCDASAGQEMTADGAATVYRTTIVTSGAGSYPLGTPIAVTALPFTPSKGDKYALYKAGEEFLAAIVETQLTPQMGVDARWVKYDAAAYDVDTLTQDLPAVSGTSTVTEQTMPRSAESIRAVESLKLTSDGSYQTEITVSWSHHHETAHIVGETVIYADGERVGSTNGTSFSFTPRVTDPGTVVQVTVQARSIQGAAFSQRRSPMVQVALRGVWSAPQAPTGFAAHMDGSQVVYSWTPPTSARGLSFEIRRGGWLLGQTVGVAEPGSSSLGPTRNWAGPAPLYLRSRDSRGQYSSAVLLDGFDPSVDGAQVLTYPTVTEQQFYADYDWSSEWNPGEPWYDAMDLTSPTRVGLVRDQLDDGSWVLKFSGSNLTGTYESDIGLLPINPPFGVPEEAYVEILANAVQVAPFTMADLVLPANDPSMARFTFEGVMALAPGDESQCTLAIEMSWTTDGVSSGWRPYRPGIYNMSAARYRFTVTRPTTGYQVRVTRFHTRISRVARKVFERDGTSSGMAARLLRYG